MHWCTLQAASHESACFKVLQSAGAKVSVSVTAAQGSVEGVNTDNYTVDRRSVTPLELSLAAQNGERLAKKRASGL